MMGVFTHKALFSPQNPPSLPSCSRWLTAKLENQPLSILCKYPGQYTCPISSGIQLQREELTAFRYLLHLQHASCLTLLSAFSDFFVFETRIGLCPLWLALPCSNVVISFLNFSFLTLRATEAGLVENACCKGSRGIASETKRCVNDAADAVVSRGED